jgi:hypothetical protein
MEEPKMTSSKQQQRPKWSRQQQAERAIVLQVLGDEHSPRWTRSELEAQLDRIDLLTVNDALALLASDGVVVLDGEDVRAAACAQRLDDLGLVGI